MIGPDQRYHLGLAFQIVDDILDFTASTDDMGKPVAADMKLGLATAPVKRLRSREMSSIIFHRRTKNKLLAPGG